MDRATQPQGKSFRDKLIDYFLNDSIPARAVQSAWSAAQLPGDVYAGRTDPMSEQAIQRAADFAGMLTLGAGAVPGSGNQLRMGAYYRRSQRPDTPDNGAGYSMFVADDPERIGHYGPNLWGVNSDDIPTSSIIEATDPRLRAATYRMFREDGVSPDEARKQTDLLNPDDIVNSAGLWDSEEAYNVYNRFLGPRGISAVKTNDGLLLFEPSFAKKLADGDAL